MITTEHLSLSQVRAYVRGALHPSTLVTIDDHLENCAACRAALARESDASFGAEAFGRALARPEARPESPHLAFEHLRGAVDGTLGAADSEWWDRAQCRGMGNDLFFDPYDESRAARQERLSMAKAICQKCTVLVDCREYALLQGEPYGVWGGLSEYERALMLGVRTLRYAGVNRERHLSVTAVQMPD